MFCPNCGAQLRDGAKFCAQCGAPAPQVDDPPSVPPTSEPTAPQAPQSAPTDESAQAAPVNEAASADEAPQPADAATPEPQAAPADAAASETETPPIAGQPTEQAPASPILRRSHDLLQKQQAGTTTSSVPATGEPILGQRRHGLGIVIGLIAAVAAVIAVLALFVVPSVVQMASPKAYLGACASRTMENYTAAWENAAKQLGVDGLADAIREERMGYRISGSIVNALDEPMLSGAGFTMDAQVDYDEQEAAAALSVQYGAIELGTLQLYLKDDLVAAGSPQLTNGQFYGVHTETLGQDIQAASWGAQADPALASLHFNLFDLAEVYMDPKSVLSDDTYDALQDATTDLLSGSDVEKLGDQTRTVNGQSETLEFFAITPEPAAVSAYISQCAELILADPDLYDAMEPFLSIQAAQQGTTPDALFAELTNEVRTSLADPSFTQTMSQLASRLEVGVRDKQIGYLGLTLTDQTSTQSFSVIAELGTPDSLIDALSLTMTDGSASYTLSSRGNHAAADGAFTDQTTILLNGSPAATLSTNWNTDSGAFSFAAVMPDANLTATGTLQADSQSMNAQLDQVSLSSGGETLALSLEYALERGTDFAFSAEDAQIITQMTLPELNSLGEQISSNAQASILGLLSAGAFF